MNEITIDLNKIAKNITDALADAVLEVADREFPEREKLERYVLSSLLNSPVEAFEKAICLAVSEEILRKVYSDEVAE